MALNINNGAITLGSLYGNGTQFKAVVANGMLAYWNPTVTWVTNSYAYAGTKKVTLTFTPPPPVTVSVTMKMGNGNNGSTWTTTTASVGSAGTCTITSSTTGFYATVGVSVTASVLGTSTTKGDASVTGSFRAYRIGDNKSGTIGTLTF